MVDNCFSVGAFCVVGALIAMILKQYCSEQSMLISIVVSVLVIAFFMTFLGETIDEIRSIFETAGISESCISIVFKVLAICCITHISAELCRDSGEGAIASAAELCGRAAIIVLSLPLMNSFVQLIDKLIKV
ncbi:stage III sporulation protein AD [Ruminococcus flavefaciens]|uniref:Stage III sporulation protein AD n=1 Tax=Ruminococcus flavefaciens TaxID=1265 RepID=A0A1H6HRW0_RUMFL|nr:stage III sporulation AC/AD family protein [Ruminococcus flavefaciens]SEH38713.1 stage III sporulation protein AD [Ruminococcus flavefaciens]